jgi:hypothetical protein
MYGKTKAKPQAREAERDLDSDAGSDEEEDEQISIDSGEHPGYLDSEEEPIESMPLKKSLNGPPTGKQDYYTPSADHVASKGVEVRITRTGDRLE